MFSTLNSVEDLSESIRSSDILTELLCKKVSEKQRGFPKANRLLSSSEFRRVYQLGRKFHSSIFTLFVVCNSIKELRIGITITRKSGNAVQRNRCKRQFREIFRCHKAELPTGLDLVVNAKKSIVQAPFAAIESEFLQVTQKLWKF